MMRVLAPGVLLCLVLAGCAGPATTTQVTDATAASNDSASTASAGAASQESTPPSSSDSQAPEATVPPQDPDPIDPETAPPTQAEAPTPLVASIAPGPRPHVLVAFSDTGFNVYHRQFYRPELQIHPCLYIEEIPCTVPALNLTVGTNDMEAALARDAKEWAKVEPDKFYWIPKTVFVMVQCSSTPSASPYKGACLLDALYPHGTHVAGAALTENPDALFVVSNSASDRSVMDKAPWDVFSYSMGWRVPMPLPGAFTSQVPLRLTHPQGVYVVAAGNDPRPILLDEGPGKPHLISVTGGWATDQAGYPNHLAAHATDVASYYCRHVPSSVNATAMELGCGTSVSAPTVAGALSKVILSVRKDSGYTGGRAGDVLDPVANLSVAQLRTAMNVTATYTPSSQYSRSSGHGVPVNPVAPWLDWGWGFYDGRVAEATIRHLNGEPTLEKPEAARLYMQTLHTWRQLYYGG